MTDPIHPQPTLYPVPPAVAYHYARAIELALRQGDRGKAFAAVDRAFDAAEDFGPMPDDVPLSDVLQSERTVRELRAGRVCSLGELCKLSPLLLRERFGFSDQAIESIRWQLEEIGRILEG